MSRYFLVEVDNSCGLTSRQIKDELQSNLESVGATASAAYLPHFAEDLRTLHTASQDTTEAIECAAALANFTLTLMNAANVERPTVKESGTTNLDRFNLTQK